jgi:hypothetical protein
MAWKYCGEARECLTAQAPQGFAPAVDAPFTQGAVHARMCHREGSVRGV